VCRVVHARLAKRSGGIALISIVHNAPKT
jgi:hypothetical protein